MTSIRQIEANRRNALHSTGPVTEDGKRRSRRNAVRHGLCAETVVEMVEDIDDYRGFEAAVIADYDAQTAVERELVLRLASLLWRLRRATAIETDLLRIQVEILRDLRLDQVAGWSPNVPSPILGGKPRPVYDVDEDASNGDPRQADRDFHCDTSGRTPQPARDLAHCFVRLANLDSGVFERLGRYESALSRQVVRILFLLKSARVR